MALIVLDPHTCADSFYSVGGERPTSMYALQNLVPAPDTADQWISRPANILQPGSAVFNPGVISGQVVVGPRVYGMVSSALNPGFDQPFCYDLSTQALVPISGITSGNVPTSPPTTGPWTPPHLELIGVYVVVTHTGFSGTGSNFFGLINIANPFALTWSTSNITAGSGGSTLPSVPVWVTQFNQRAYFTVVPANTQPAVIHSDVLVPNTFNVPTSPYSNVLTFGDNLPLVATAALPLDNQLGGQTQSLIVFKGVTNMFQVTGDGALGTLTINSLPVATGTLAPNSIVASPIGLFFLSPDGIRLLDFAAHVSEPLGVGGTGVSTPFLTAVVPSRVAGACNATTLRYTTQNGAAVGAPLQDWAFDLNRKVWHGPHTFPVSLVSPFGSGFVVAGSGSAFAGIWGSSFIPSSTSTYTEIGLNYASVFQTALFPFRESLNNLSCVSTIQYLGYSAAGTKFAFDTFDEDGVGLVSTGITLSNAATGNSPIKFGTLTWFAIDVPWPHPLIFDHLTYRVTVAAAAGVRFGRLVMDIEEEGYRVPVPGALGIVVNSIVPDPGGIDPGSSGIPLLPPTFWPVPPPFPFPSATSWPVPPPFPPLGGTVGGGGSTNYKIECIGGGGNGNNGDTFAAPNSGTLLPRTSGGGGGAYARVNSVALIVGSVATIQIGQPGGTVNNGLTTNIANTWFTPNGVNTPICLAAGGTNAGTIVGSTRTTCNGKASDSIGNVTFNGGDGSPNLDRLPRGSTGGGGAAGPNGAGASGLSDNTAGALATNSAGGAGDNNAGGGGGMSGANADDGHLPTSTPPTAGSNGGAGGEIATSVGAGGGGGGGGTEPLGPPDGGNGAAGGNGGLYGGGGGQGGCYDPNSLPTPGLPGAGGKGAQGVIVITKLSNNAVTILTSGTTWTVV